MKKLVSISLFIFWAAVTAILVAGLVYYQNKPCNCPATIISGANSTTSATGELILDMAEISKHSSVNDCWLLINNKIYNVSSYLSVHPGGVGTISSYCGKEASQAFATKDIGRPHSGYASQLLNNYYLGDLNQKINLQQIQNNVQKTNTVPSPAGGGGYEDD
jgi:hypothetical protein